MKCPNCSYEIENVNARKCPSCGARIARKAKEQIHEEEQSNDNKTEVMPPQKQDTPMQETELAKMFCPSCGNAITDDANFCPHCGYEVRSVLDDSPQQTEESSQQPASEPMQLDEQLEELVEVRYDFADNVRSENLDEYIDNGEYQPDENDSYADRAHDEHLRDKGPRPFDEKQKSNASAINPWIVIVGAVIISILIGALLYLVV